MSEEKTDAQIKELIALAKSKPGQLNYGASTIDSSNHLSVELLKSMAGINIVHINYKGGNLMINGLLGGEVQVLIASGSTLLPYASAGRLRALAVTSAQPSALAPGLPAIASSGLPGYEFVPVDGLFGPAKAAATVIARLNQEMVRYLNSPKVKEQFFVAGSEAASSSPEEFAAVVKSEMTRLGKLVRISASKLTDTRRPRAEQQRSGPEGALSRSDQRPQRADVIDPVELPQLLQQRLRPRGA